MGSQASPDWSAMVPAVARAAGKPRRRRRFLAAWLFSFVPLLAGHAASTDPAATVAPSAGFRDFASLSHYAQANQALPPPASGEHRVVFIGDSITDGWASSDPGFFAGAGAVRRINRGIGGQTSPQMLLRFRQDVVALRPAVVHILAGTNDVARNWGAMALEDTEASIASMAEMARANRIRVVIGSIPPVKDFPWRPGLDPGFAIEALNEWLRNYCRASGCVYVDYYSVLSDGRGGARPGVTYDGVHPTRAGYRLMEPLADAAIVAALGDVTPNPR